MKRFLLLLMGGVALSADHGDINSGFIQALNRLCEDRIHVDWDLVHGDEVSGIQPCITPTPGVLFQLGLSDAGLVTVPPNDRWRLRIRFFDPDAFELLDEEGRPLMLAPVLPGVPDDAEGVAAPRRKPLNRGWARAMTRLCRDRIGMSWRVIDPDEVAGVEPVPFAPRAGIGEVSGVQPVPFLPDIGVVSGVEPIPFVSFDFDLDGVAVVTVPPAPDRGPVTITIQCFDPGAFELLDAQDRPLTLLPAR